MFETKVGIVFFVAGVVLLRIRIPVQRGRAVPHVPRHAGTVRRKNSMNGNLRYQFEDLAQRFPGVVSHLLR